MSMKRYRLFDHQMAQNRARKVFGRQDSDYIVMLHLPVHKTHEEEGFATSRIEISQNPDRQPFRPIKDRIPQPKELIQLVRPQETQPRILYNGIETTLLPDFLGLEDEEQGPSIGPNVPLTKIEYFGKGKTLYDYFMTPDFSCLYDKYLEKRSVSDMYYDFTSKIRVVELNNDYDWKTYKKLKEPSGTAQDTQSQMQFDSNFESGNARFVYEHNRRPLHYYVLLENDTNTHGYNQWFFFRVRNKSKGPVTIHIVNMIKRQSLYRQGMKVSIFSTKRHEKSKTGWFKGGTSIGYNNTGIQRTTKENQTHYCLSFNYRFEYEEDSVYFALTVPYTYSKLGTLLRQVSEQCYTNGIPYTERILGYTMSNNKISCMRIGFEEQTKKKVIVFMARQHPCETMGSEVCHGLAKYLVSNSIESQYLLTQFSFMIIPMVNPDGVIYGNSRCNLSGIDLNRQWTDPTKELTPETFCIKKHLERCHEEYTIQYIIDLHGHSKKMNSFFYCCEKKDKAEARLFSIVMGKLCKQFDYASCTYSLTKDKANTIRGKFTSIGVDCYTLENSYFGWGSKSNNCYTHVDFRKIGQDLIRALYVMNCPCPNPQLGYETSKSVVIDQIRKNINKLQAEEKFNQGGSGSDSDPEGDFFDMDERMGVIQIKGVSRSLNQSIIKGLTSVSKHTRYENPLVISHRNAMEKKILQTQYLQFKRRKNGKHSLNIDPNQLILEQASLVQLPKKQTVKMDSVSKKRQITTGRQSKLTRLASSLKRPSRQEYFGQQDQRPAPEIPKAISNPKLQQPIFARKRPISSYRNQSRFLTNVKKKQKASLKAKTQGQQLCRLVSGQNQQQRSKSPDEEGLLRVIQIGYLQQRKERNAFREEPPVSKSKEVKRTQLLSNSKFKRFESFLQGSDRMSQSLYKQLANRVLYRFPIL